MPRKDFSIRLIFVPFPIYLPVTDAFFNGWGFDWFLCDFIYLVCQEKWISYFLPQGNYFQVGDIVSLVDHDFSVYYAQIRGFMKDQYNEKSAIISWLLPSQGSPQDRFDPATYILGQFYITGNT